MTKLKRSLSRQRPSRAINADRIYSDALTHMYFEDWTSDILPFVYHNAGKHFKVLVSPENQREFITTLFNVRGPDNESVEESLSEFVKEVAQCLILYNGAAYELCEVEDGETRKHVLNLVPRETLKVTSSEVSQHLQEAGSAKTYRIERTRVFLLESPNWIEGGAGFSATIESLLSLSHQEFSPIKFLERQSKGETTFFDFAKFRQYQEIEVLKDTARSGWNGRGLYTDKMTEFYYFVRYLRFKKAQAQLRDYILKEINVFLAGLEGHGFPKITINIEGLLSDGEIEKLLSDLETGAVGFKDIVSCFKGL